MRCANCGEDFDDARPYCPNCGASRVRPTTPPGSTIERPHDGVAIAAIVAVIAVVTIAGGLFLVAQLGADANAQDALADSAPQQTVAVLWGVRDALHVLILVGVGLAGLLAVIAVLLGFVLVRLGMQIAEARAEAE